LSGAPGVSVVVPVHNGASTLRETLASIAAQDRGGRPLEIIVVNDGSRDASAAIIEDVARRVPLRVVEGTHRGAAAAVNTGLRAASHPLIAQIDQDVILEPGWLDRVLVAFDDPRVGAVQGRYAAIRSDPFFARVMALDLEQRYAGLSNVVDHVCTGNTVYRASALARIGLLNEALGYGYDNDSSYRLAAAGYRLVFCREARSQHRWRDGLVGYLTQQYGFGYGRLDVVAAHPTKVGGDAVSPAAMMAHPAITVVALSCLVASVGASWLGASAWPWVWAGAGLAGVLLVERTVAGVRAWQQFGDPAALAFPVVHAARDLAWVVAVVMWCARRLLGLAGGPKASMTPRPVSE
jgi:hypothetical protein